MKRKTLFLGMAFLAATCALYADEDPDYSRGILFLNEDWFGHRNGSMNYLRADGQWEYRVFGKENAGMELGCASQYGAIFNERLYIISSQTYNYESAVGGRITVCDAQTLKCIKQIKAIAVDSNGKSIADGRAFVGINEKKAYVSSSNGIYVFSLEDLEVKGTVCGTGAENGGLYSAQCGTMVCHENKVFAVHQQKGLLVIDTEKDSVVHIVGAPVEMENGTPVQRGFGSIVQSKDSSLWLSVAANLTGRGATVDYFFRLDPATLDTTRIALPSGYGLPTSWYAWTADAFCASVQQNKLYWKKQGEGWFTNSLIVCYDIDKNECSDFFDTQEIGWYMYCGAGFRLHPKTDEMYVSLYQDNLKNDYATLKINAKGEVLTVYEMADHYWFPAMPVFPLNSDTIASGGNSGNPDNPVANEQRQDVVKSIYPNPTAELVYVRLAQPAVLELFSIDGRLLLRRKCGAGEQCVRLPKSGVYFVRVSSTAGLEVKRIVRR